MAPSLPTHAYPGLSLGPSSSYLPGPGTYVHKDTIIASLAGTPTTTPSKSSSSLPTLSIARPTPSLRAPLSRSIVNASTFPRVGSTVLARVTRLEKARVSVNILVVDNSTSAPSKTTQTPSPSTPSSSSGTVVADPLPAVIRREDVRGWDIDKVNVPEMFRVGDIVRASVVSIGDQQAYYLSTARNELGVLMARSEETGEVMVPVSWREVRDARTGRVEGRKVAKPV